MMDLEEITPPDSSTATAQMECRISRSNEDASALPFRAATGNEKNQAALLNLLIHELGLKNDAALCRVLGVTPPVISKIRTGKLRVGARLLIRMNEESGLSIRDMKSYVKERQREVCASGTASPPQLTNIK